MNAFERLLDLPAPEKRAKGVEFTAPEIAQQPAVWVKAARMLRERRDDVLAFLAPPATLVLAGAGTSEFVGNAIAGALRGRLRREVLSVATTDLVTHPGAALIPGRPYVLVSFARSGNSPESLAACRLARRVCPDLRELVITCNRDGALARAAAGSRSSLCLVLPEETNDRSLAMTSSFSTLALTGLGLGWMDEPDAFERTAGDLARAAARVMAAYGDAIWNFAARPFVRACFLGSHALRGTMQECHLKMQEMTDGRVACRFDSFLGLRHGPQVFVNGECAVVAALSTDPGARRYEMDLLRELASKRQGCGTLVIADRAGGELRALGAELVELFPGGGAVPDEFRVMTDVVAGQMLAMFKSLQLGLKPDAPSASGTIHRVVQGVIIYDT